MVGVLERQETPPTGLATLAPVLVGDLERDLHRAGTGQRRGGGIVAHLLKWVPHMCEVELEELPRPPFCHGGDDSTALPLAPWRRERNWSSRPGWTSARSRSAGSRNGNGAPAT